MNEPMNNAMQIGPKDIVLVTGGTGFTGSHLVKYLVEKGAVVRVLARASSNRGDLADLPIEWFVGDVFDEATVQSAVQNVSVVFHVAAAYREAKISDEIYWNVHVKSTQLLAAEALKQPDFKRFVHVSTVGVHGHIDEPPADETYRFAPGDEYQNTKVEAELWIRQFAADNALPVCVVRPAAIYGPGDRRLLKVFKLAKLPVCPLIGFNCKGLYHLIHVDDLVRFFVHVAEHPDAVGEIFICGNEQASSIREMVSIIGESLGRDVKFITLPATPFFLLGDACEWVCKPLGIEPPIYRRRVAFFTKDRSFDTSKMRAVTGFTCQHSNEEGMQALAQWYKQEGWL
ncbi:NAD-dependent epimerase/dehydratase family protein [bacterium]|nr:NAD-dependent epimerase/dehydratase family protein [bacterium]